MNPCLPPLLMTVPDNSYVFAFVKAIHSAANENNFRKDVQILTKTWQQLLEYVSVVSSNGLRPRLNRLIQNTLITVLHGDWSLPVNRTYKLKLQDAIREFKSTNGCHMNINKTFLDIIEEPWGNAVLKKILNAEQVTEEEVFQYFSSEDCYVIKIRFSYLCTLDLDDLALNYTRVYLRYLRSSRTQLNIPECNLALMQYAFDIYLVYSLKYDQIKDFINELKPMSLKVGLNLVQRFKSKLVCCRGIKRYCVHVANIAATYFIARAMTEPLEDTHKTLMELLSVWLSENTDKCTIRNGLRKIIQAAISSEHIYIISEIVIETFGNHMKGFLVETYMRIITTAGIELEKQKLFSKRDDDTKIALIHLSNTFLALADLFSNHVKVCQELVLTSFSIYPNIACLTRLENLVMISSKINGSLTKKYDWKTLCQYGTGSNRRNNNQIVIALDQILNAEILEISPELCDDLNILVMAFRNKLLNWNKLWPNLKRACIVYMKQFQQSQKINTESQALKIDYSKIKRRNEKQSNIGDVENKVPVIPVYFYIDNIKIMSTAANFQPTVLLERLPENYQDPEAISIKSKQRKRKPLHELNYIPNIISPKRLCICNKTEILNSVKDQARRTKIKTSKKR